MLLFYCFYFIGVVDEPLYNIVFPYSSWDILYWCLSCAIPTVPFHSVIYVVQLKCHAIIISFMLYNGHVCIFVLLSHHLLSEHLLVPSSYYMVLHSCIASTSCQSHFAFCFCFTECYAIALDSFTFYTATTAIKTEKNDQEMKIL